MVWVWLLWYIHTAQKWDWARDRHRDQWVLTYYTGIFQLVQERDRDQDSLFPIVPALLPVSSDYQSETV